jgi:5-methylcytosine-specific restriction enzyme subunit McrC
MIKPVVSPYVFKEWESRTIDNVKLTSDDKELLDNLPVNDCFKLDALLEGIKFSATSWIGVVKFTNFEVQIIPKLAGEHLGLLQLIDYVLDLDAFKHSLGVRTLCNDGCNLLDLLALLFAEACEKLIRQGILSDYVERETDLATLKGKMLVDRQVRLRFGRVDRIECRYDEYESDIIENQIITLALSVIENKVKHEATKRKIRNLILVFEGVCKKELCDVATARKSITYNRLNRHYKEAHNLAWLIFDSFGVNDFYKEGRTKCFTFLLDMNSIFELFLYKWIKQLMSSMNYSLRYQAKDNSIIWNATDRRSYSRVIPDLLLKNRDHDDQLLAIDAKYKNYDERKVAPEDVYQMFLYAYAYGKSFAGSHPALLVYPATNVSSAIKELNIRNTFGLVGARIYIQGLYIPEALKEASIDFQGSFSKSFLGTIVNLAS